ncbi:transporter (plasmid) [Deinococcus psychrotolerans]|uniref:Transporter n=2 Tax=Deinococcus TaxID=1298 RepID=A0A553V522_9DEIO|nr:MULTISPECIES: TOBE domain-containing protein [Deinococcus]AZI44737.1 transporter [Deinococcus psychrotolerans]TSA87542.1 transporter [Deinococcus detaillensis]
MKISAHNQLSGTISAIKLGEVAAEITLDVAPGTSITATITRSSAERLGLKVGQTANAVIKASDVMIGVED